MRLESTPSTDAGNLDKAQRITNRSGKRTVQTNYRSREMLETTTTDVDTDHLDRVQPRDATPPPPAPRESDPVLVQADLLVEDVSIDGMCGVY